MCGPVGGEASDDLRSDLDGGRGRGRQAEEQRSGCRAKDFRIALGLRGLGQRLETAFTDVNDEEVAASGHEELFPVGKPLDVVLADAAVGPIKNRGGRGRDGGVLQLVERNDGTLFAGADVVEGEVAAIGEDETLSVRRPCDGGERGGRGVDDRIDCYWLLRGRSFLSKKESGYQ